MAEPVQGESPAPTQDISSFPDLVMRARAGDVAAFEDLFQAYTVRITTYLTRMVENNKDTSFVIFSAKTGEIITGGSSGG